MAIRQKEVELKSSRVGTDRCCEGVLAAYALVVYLGNPMAARANRLSKTQQ